MASSSSKRRSRSVDVFACFCTLLLQQTVISSSDGWTPDSTPPASTTTTSRRRFVAASVALATASPLLWLDDRGDTSMSTVAWADPRNALLPMGSGGVLQQRATVIKADGWERPPNMLRTKLASSRIQSEFVSPLQQPPFGPQELYYPDWLFGEWNVTATLQQKTFPFGKDFVPSRSLLDGSPRNRDEQVGDMTTYKARYFSTLAVTVANQVTVNLGLGVPQSKIISDRAYNIISMNRAYQQQSPIDSVMYDYRQDPTRLTLQFNEVANDMRPIGPRRSEVYLSARQTEEAVMEDGDGRGVVGEKAFALAERSRTVTVGSGTVSANDQEVVTEYSIHTHNDGSSSNNNVNNDVDDNDTIHAISRVAVYLTPNPNSREGVLWQQVRGRAVALYDYELVMKRYRQAFTLEDGSTVLRPCVLTPKDVVQCF